MMEEKTGVKFSEKFLDMAFVALVSDGFKTEHDRALWDCICEVCAAEGISVRKYMNALTKMCEKVKELEKPDED